MSPALEGITVVDSASLFAGPLAATILGDFGAEIVKIEHPTKPDPSRSHGPSKDGVGLWWKMLGRNKSAMTLNLSAPRAREVLFPLLSQADVFIENFRPGTLERWGLGPEILHECNPKLVIARVSGFGQVGPMRERPGFGTLAEAMSGFAAINGAADGPPTLPPFGLADGVTALSLCAAIMMALRVAEQTGAGQVIDIAIIEPMLTLLGPQITAFDQLGVKQDRTGNRSSNNAPRNVYLSRDDVWLSVSTSANPIAERVLRLVGHPEVLQEEWFGTGHGRAAHADLLDGYVATWIADRDAAEVVKAFEDADAAIAPVYDVEDILADPQYAALGSVVQIEDDELGPIRMQNVMYRLSRTPGQIRWPGRPHGADTRELLTSRLGLDIATIEDLYKEGVI